MHRMICGGRLIRCPFCKRSDGDKIIIICIIDTLIGRRRQTYEQTTIMTITPENNNSHKQNSRNIRYTKRNKMILFDTGTNESINKKTITRFALITIAYLFSLPFSVCSFFGESKRQFEQHNKFYENRYFTYFSSFSHSLARFQSFSLSFHELLFRFTDFHFIVALSTQFHFMIWIWNLFFWFILFLMLFVLCGSFSKFFSFIHIRCWVSVLCVRFFFLLLLLLLFSYYLNHVDVCIILFYVFMCIWMYVLRDCINVFSLLLLILFCCFVFHIW